MYLSISITKSNLPLEGKGQIHENTKSSHKTYKKCYKKFFWRAVAPGPYHAAIEFSK